MEETNRGPTSTNLASAARSWAASKRHANTGLKIHLPNKGEGLHLSNFFAVLRMTASHRDAGRKAFYSIARNLQTQDICCMSDDAGAMILSVCRNRIFSGAAMYCFWGGLLQGRPCGSLAAGADPGGSVHGPPAGHSRRRPAAAEAAERDPRLHPRRLPGQWHQDLASMYHRFSILLPIWEQGLSHDTRCFCISIKMVLLPWGSFLVSCLAVARRPSCQLFVEVFKAGPT